MVAEARRYGQLYEQKDYDCQRCGAAETPEMSKRVRDYMRPYCDPCIEAMKHENHAPTCTHTTVRTKIVNGKTTEERESVLMRIEDCPNRCFKCFPR